MNDTARVQSILGVACRSFVDFTKFSLTISRSGGGGGTVDMI